MQWFNILCKNEKNTHLIIYKSQKKLQIKYIQKVDELSTWLIHEWGRNRKWGNMCALFCRLRDKIT